MDPAGSINALSTYSVSALDELLTFDADGEIDYRAAESYEVNEDSTVWTFSAGRSGVVGRDAGDFGGFSEYDDAGAGSKRERLCKLSVSNPERRGDLQRRDGERRTRSGDAGRLYADFIWKSRASIFWICCGFRSIHRPAVPMQKKPEAAGIPTQRPCIRARLRLSAESCTGTGNLAA